MHEPIRPPTQPPTDASALLPPAELDRLRTALTGYTVDGVADLLGPVGRAAHQRGDLAGVAREVRRTASGSLTALPDPVATFVRLFLLGVDVPERDAAAAFAPLGLDAATAGGIVARSGDRVRALLEIRPYAEESPLGRTAADSEPPWWVVSDLGSDVRPGPLAHDHVLGIGNAATTLAQATPRGRVGRALDIGTGCGVQALHLARHADRVTATDISGRALRFAATTAALSGQAWDLRHGSFVEPVAGEGFDLVVANPPFVVSPGAGGADDVAHHGYDYRDSGRAGDAVCRDLVGGIAGLLNDGGTGQLLANWVVPVDGSWQERVAAWFPPGVTAWVWQRELADLGEYVSMWLRDAGLQPDAPEWNVRYDAWLDWFAGSGVAAIGMGLITLRRDSRHQSEEAPARVVTEDVPQPVEQPIADEIAAWFDRYPATRDDRRAELLRATLRPAPDLVRTHHDLLEDEEGWRTRRALLRQSHGMRWEVEADDTVARIVAACAAGAPPLTALELLAALGDDGDDGDDGTDDVATLAERFVPVLADLVRRGFLLPGSSSR